jgi:starch synthase
VAPLNVLQLAAEVTPFAKTGGLGDVVAGLSRFLGRKGHDVRIFLPFYSNLANEPERYAPVEFIQDVSVQLGPRRFTWSARTAPLPGSEVSVYFIDCPPLFQQGGIYHGDWSDSLRFALLTVAAFECAQRMGWTSCTATTGTPRWRRSTAGPTSIGTSSSSGRGPC